MTHLFRLTLIIFGLVFLTSCVNSNRQVTGTDTVRKVQTPKTVNVAKASNKIAEIRERRKQRLADLKERRQKRLDAQRARIAKMRSIRTVNTSAFTKPAYPAVKPKSKAAAKIKRKSKTKAKARVHKASVTTRSRSSGKIIQRASLRCVPKSLRSVIYQVSRKFGTVIVNSTGRSRRHNRSVGGARRSYHIGCRAVDFRVRGNQRGLYRYLRSHPSVGGLKRYRSGFYHIDNGPRRSW